MTELTFQTRTFGLIVTVGFGKWCPLVTAGGFLPSARRRHILLNFPPADEIGTAILCSYL